MLTKFIRDKYGLQLQLTASNDEERALMAEMVKASTWRPRGVRLNVMKEITNGTVNKITVMNGGFINANVLRSYGFKKDKSLAPSGISMYRKISYTVLVIVGTCTLNIYAINISTDCKSLIINTDDSSNIIVKEIDERDRVINTTTTDLESKSIKVRNVFELDVQMQKLIAQYTIVDSGNIDKKE